MTNNHCANKGPLGQRSSRLVLTAFSKIVSLEADKETENNQIEEPTQEMPVVLERDL